jgi:hypothetical protein
VIAIPAYTGSVLVSYARSLIETIVPTVPPNASHTDPCNTVPLRPNRLEQMERLVTADGRVLPERLMAEIRRHLTRLVLVLEMLAEVEAERDRGERRKGRSSTLGIGPSGESRLRRISLPPHLGASGLSTSVERPGAASRAKIPAWRPQARPRVARSELTGG